MKKKNWKAIASLICGICAMLSVWISTSYADSLLGAIVITLYILYTALPIFGVIFGILAHKDPREKAMRRIANTGLFCSVLALLYMILANSLLIWSYLPLR